MLEHFHHESSRIRHNAESSQYRLWNIAVAKVETGSHSMAKASSTPRKKATKLVEPPAPPTPTQRAKSWFFQPRQLIMTTFFAMFLVAIPVAIRNMPTLSGRPEYQVGPDQVTISPPPRWIPPDLTKQVFAQAGLSETNSLQDPSLSERIAAGFHTHPWIERVISVRKSFPARVHVEVIYREPVAMVKGIDGHYPIDKNGVLLPARDFSDSDVERFPVIEQVASVPMGKLGEPWGDPAVAGAAELAAVLNKEREGKRWWQELDLTSILVPRRVALADGIDELQYELRTSGGSEIQWGRAPKSQHPGELTVAQKIERLSGFRKDYGSFDDQHGPYQIDIRPWQGIQRDILAREQGETRIR